MCIYKQRRHIPHQLTASLSKTCWRIPSDACSSWDRGSLLWKEYCPTNKEALSDGFAWWQHTGSRQSYPEQRNTSQDMFTSCLTPNTPWLSILFNPFAENSFQVAAQLMFGRHVLWPPKQVLRHVQCFARKETEPDFGPHKPQTNSS